MLNLNYMRLGVVSNKLITERLLKEKISYRPEPRKALIADKIPSSP